MPPEWAELGLGLQTPCIDCAKEVSQLLESGVKRGLSTSFLTYQLYIWSNLFRSSWLLLPYLENGDRNNIHFIGGVKFVTVWKGLNFTPVMHTIFGSKEHFLSTYCVAEPMPDGSYRLCNSISTQQPTFPNEKTEACRNEIMCPMLHSHQGAGNLDLCVSLCIIAHGLLGVSVTKLLASISQLCP